MVMQDEKCARKKYASLAKNVSLSRYRSAVDIVEKVNAMLPDLEMRDKRVRVVLSSMFDVEASISSDCVSSTKLKPDDDDDDLLEGLSPHSVRRDGWDRMSLIVDKEDGSIRSIDFPAVQCVVESTQLMEQNLSEDLDQESVSGVSKVGISGGTLLGSLSSGEGARLALALETVCCRVGDGNIIMMLIIVLLQIPNLYNSSLLCRF